MPIFKYPWKHKKCAQKVAHNRLQTHKYRPAAQISSELIFYIINMSQDSSVSLSVIIPHNLFGQSDQIGQLFAIFLNKSPIHMSIVHDKKDLFLDDNLQKANIVAFADCAWLVSRFTKCVSEVGETDKLELNSLQHAK